MADGTVQLRLHEAVDLGHAWVQQLADSRGIRSLLIKGPSLHRQGLRDERVSSDIDVMIDPARFIEFCEAVEDAGWREREGIFISELSTLHSRTYLRDDWPCDLDIHSYFPGFLATPQHVFDVLWARRQLMSFAARPCAVPDRLSNVLVLALHSVRSSDLLVRHDSELTQLQGVTLTSVERTELGSLALQTGCVATLEHVLPSLGVFVEPSREELESPRLADWRQRVASGSHGAYFWMLAFRNASTAGKVGVIARAIWPSDHDLLVARPEIPNRFWAKLRGRGLRWGRGLRSLPRTLRAVLTTRK